MSPIRVLACSVGLVIALSPLASFAAESTGGSHAQAELQNAAAQLTLAQQLVDELQAQANLSAQNERTIGLLRSEVFREHQLDVSSNGMAIQQIGQALANSIRQQGDISARNELAIAQIRASALVMRADANLANALAQGRQDEISNSQAQSTFLHHLADVITSVQAEQNMSSAKLNAEARAGDANTHGITEAANGSAMGAQALFAADFALAAGQLAATSATISQSAKQAAVLAHATASLKNAQAMAAQAR